MRNGSKGRGQRAQGKGRQREKEKVGEHKVEVSSLSGKRFAVLLTATTSDRKDYWAVFDDVLPTGLMWPD